MGRILLVISGLLIPAVFPSGGARAGCKPVRTFAPSYVAPVIAYAAPAVIVEKVAIVPTYSVGYAYGGYDDKDSLKGQIRLLELEAEVAKNKTEVLQLKLVLASTGSNGNGSGPTAYHAPNLAGPLARCASCHGPEPKDNKHTFFDASGNWTGSGFMALKGIDEVIKGRMPKRQSITPEEGTQIISKLTEVGLGVAKNGN